MIAREPPTMSRDFNETTTGAKAPETHGWIHIRDLTIEGVSLGVYPHERQRARAIQITLSVLASVSRAAATDDIVDAVDYDRLIVDIEKLCRSRHFNLLEALSETIAGHVLDIFPVQRIIVEVHKPNIRLKATASVVIDRSRMPLKPQRHNQQQST